MCVCVCTTALWQWKPFLIQLWILPLKRQSFSVPDLLLLREVKRLYLSCVSWSSEKKHPVFVGEEAVWALDEVFIAHTQCVCFVDQADIFFCYKIKFTLILTYKSLIHLSPVRTNYVRLMRIFCRRWTGLRSVQSATWRVWPPKRAVRVL
jgi:hypothetical protein